MTINAAVDGQELGVPREVGAMAGEAAQGLLGTGIFLTADRVVSDGMTAALVLVASEAGLLNLAAWEALRFAAMGCVAQGALAFHHRLVPRGGHLGLLPQLLVALEAKILGIARQ